MRTTPVCLLLSAALTAPALAQAPALERGGGALPGTSTWTVAATPGSIYAVVVSQQEVPTEILPGVELAIGTDLLSVTLQVPGFLGVLPGSGSATASLPINNPSLAGIQLSAQALVGPLFDMPSNLVRTTLALPGTFAETVESPAAPILGGAIAQLGDGDLLLVGGSGPLAQRYSDELESFELAGVTFGVGLLSQSTGLADGRVLFTGGLDLSGQPTADAAVFDPVTGLTTEISMGTPRAGHQATLLDDGRVFVTGGFENVTIDLAGALANPLALLDVFQSLLGSTEFFDPVAGAFTSGPNMLEPRALHTATALPGGSVLVAGGLSLIPFLNIPTVSQTAATFSPLLGTFGLPILFSGPRLLHSAALMSDGSVILVGGLTLDLTDFLTSGDPTQLAVGARDDIERFTSGFFGGSFSTAGQLSEARALAGVAALDGGRALVAGGCLLYTSPSPRDS